MTENTPGDAARSQDDIPTAPHAAQPPPSTQPPPSPAPSPSTSSTPPAAEAYGQPADQARSQPADQPGDRSGPTRRTWRERAAGARRRTFGLRGLVAAALAALIVGGLGGFAIGAATGGEHRDGSHERSGFSGPGGRDGFGRGGDRDDRFAPPGGMPAPVPPTTEPDTGTDPETDPDSGSTETPSSDLSS